MTHLRLDELPPIDRSLATSYLFASAYHRDDVEA
jgi:hypothetical protein